MWRTKDCFSLWHGRRGLSFRVLGMGERGCGERQIVLAYEGGVEKTNDYFNYYIYYYDYYSTSTTSTTTTTTTTTRSPWARLGGG